MHSTKNKDDSYLGSGKILLLAIKKYGRSNFKKEILDTCPSREDLAKQEKEIVCEELLKNPLCMNLKLGGDGGGHPGSGCGMPVGFKHSKDTKDKIAMASTGRVYGPLSSSRKEAISKRHLGKKQSEAAKLAISAASIKTHSEIWDVEYNGKTLRVNNLKDFCIQNNLKYTTMLLSSKQRRPTKSGWSISKATI